MDLFFKALLGMHIAAGFTSLLLFWIPIFTRKGSLEHRRIGKLYVWLMWIVVSTAAILSIENLFTGQVNMALYLGFIALITADPIWYGVAILKHKKGVSDRFMHMHLAFQITIAIAGLGLILYGISIGGKGMAVLMFIFGGLGLSNIPGIIQTIKSPSDKFQWFKDHIVGMCTSAIAAYTAFFVFGGNQFFSSFLPGYWAIIPWVAPTFIGTFGIKYTVNHYRKKGAIR